MPSVSGNQNGKRVLRVGTVAYDPKVVTIWEGFKPYFEKHGAPIDYVLYSSYDAQVAANLAGEVDVAWNSPLAWVRSQLLSAGQCRAIAMRDKDGSHYQNIVRKKTCRGESGGSQREAQCSGRFRFTAGYFDSALTRGRCGRRPGKDCRVIEHNVMVGKHGDHVGGERDAARALAAGTVDAACVLDANYAAFINEDTLDPGTTRVLATYASV